MLFTVYHCQYPGFKTGANYSLLKQGRGCPPFFRGSIKWAWGSFHCKVRLPMPWMWTGRAKLMGVTQTNGSPKTGLFLLRFWFVSSKDAQSFFGVQTVAPFSVAMANSRGSRSRIFERSRERTISGWCPRTTRNGSSKSTPQSWRKKFVRCDLVEWCGCWGNSGVMSTRITKPLGCVFGDKMIRML